MSYYVGNGCFYFKDDDLSDQREKLLHEMHNISDMLDGEVNRIFVTDDLYELYQMYIAASNNLLKLYQSRFKILNLER